MTAITKKPVNPTAHLTPEDIEQLGIELDAIRQDVLDTRGEKDAAYIRKVIDVQRQLELGSPRGAARLGASRRPGCSAPSACRVAKILENMEIGHNVLHGQWDWMRDPKIHSTTWEWDNATPAEQWKHSHNEIHHTYTNIVGKDNDLGYGIMRVDEDQRWHPFFLAPAVLELHQRLLLRVRHRGLRPRARPQPADPQGEAASEPSSRRSLEERARARSASRPPRTTSSTRRWRSRPARFLPTLAANFTANMVRNVWSHSVIMCGHFPEGVETFEQKSIPDDETRGEWYLRQMLGSANISGSKAMHLMSGNLSHQIEHHLFPDLPSNRYAEVAPQGAGAVREVRPELPHPRRCRSRSTRAWHKVVRLSLPNGWLATTNAKNLPQQLKLLWAMTTEAPRSAAPPRPGSSSRPGSSAPPEAGRAASQRASSRLREASCTTFNERPRRVMV